MKTPLNNVVLPTLFNVVNNIVQHYYTRLRANSGTTMLNNIVDNIEQPINPEQVVRFLLCKQREQRVDTIKREMFSQKSVRRFVGDSSAFVMGAMFLASALNRGISPRY